MGSVERLPIEDTAKRRLSDTGLIRLSSALDRLPDSFFSRANQVVIDGALSLVSLWLAYLLRFDGVIPASYRATLWAWTIILPVLRPALMYATGGYDRIWRYFSMRDAFMLAATALPATIVLAAARVGFGKFWVASIPLGVIAIEYVVYLAGGTFARALRRLTFEAARTSGPRLRTLVVGSPDTLAEALRRVSSYTDIQIVGLLAPESKVHGLRIGGFPVMDEPAALARLLASHAIDVVLIAEAGIESMSELVSTATEFGVDVRLLPTAQNVLRGEVRTSVTNTPESFFARHGAATMAPAHPDVVAAFRDRVVVVTGAGGSIGSELARQVAHLPVRQLILLDQDENSIFEIHRELHAENACSLTPVVADICDGERIERLFAQYRPHVVLHAAAYKHVPVMEQNCSEAVINNVFGTRILAEMSERYQSERFLMISTDKAVHPSSVMGATKRVAELLVQSAACAQRKTRMACVRFGNVVGSRGSVVPIFLKQIAEGQPVTITDENMTRYFMTIPEAVQLVLQAVTLGSNGDVYMLDMGDPMRIMALARKLIEMSGLRPDIDIPIRIVGTRPGEKLHEMLWPADAEVARTSFARVMAVKASPPPSSFAEALARLESAAHEGDDARVRTLLRELPIGYGTAEKAAVATIH
ncbi:MAG TPA: nucleoside-diphosphate sugar epimerase/dehydratase [Terriglobales bacterium]|nr:nucleoside-diphosphate sugar epimerase/dehydratase [Terriglobales bacterium]